jgi:hypothetical protein
MQAALRLRKEHHHMTVSTDSGVADQGAVRTQPVAERLTFALVPKAAADLQRLQDRTSLSKTDIANRAISLYEFIDTQLTAGREVLIRDVTTGDIQSVKIF